MPNFIRHVAKKEMLRVKRSALYSKLKVLPKRTVRVIISENRPDLIYFQEPFKLGYFPARRLRLYFGKIHFKVMVPAKRFHPSLDISLNNR